MSRNRHRHDKPHDEPPPGSDEGAEGFVNDVIEHDGDTGDESGTGHADEAPPADKKPAANVTRSKRKNSADGTDPEKPPPPYGTAKPAGPGALPRVVPELARAGKGETRYKIACRNYSPQKTRYVLAAEGDEDGAVECYLQANGLDKVLAKLKKRAKDPDDVEQPELVVTELAD